jgi:hypothetical protein
MQAFTDAFWQGVLLGMRSKRRPRTFALKKRAKLSWKCHRIGVPYRRLNVRLDVIFPDYRQFMAVFFVRRPRKMRRGRAASHRAYAHMVVAKYRRR